MSLGNGNPREGDKGSNFDFERKSLKLLQAIADATSGDLPENSKLCTYQLNGFSAAGLNGRSLILLSPSSANDAFLYGSFNPAAFNVSQTNAANVAILDIGARFSGIVYYELGVVLASTIGLTANIRPALGVTSLVSGSVTSTYTNNFGAGVNPSSTTTGSITYLSGVINYTPSGTGDQIIFGLSEVANVQLTNGNMHVFGNLKFVLL